MIPIGEGGTAMQESLTVTVRRAEAGDQEAWNALVDRFGNLLWSVARAHRLSPTDAGDVFQTTWLRLLENLDRIDDPERLAGWLATTARRECLRLLRRSGREHLGLDDDAALDVVDEQVEPLDARLLADERDAALWACFERLSSRCQTLLRILMATPPPAYADVALSLDMPIGSIGPTRGRCLERLRQLGGAVIDLDSPHPQGHGGQRQVRTGQGRSS
jgi:RNA polymerase sigma factor (sigma-70 family)